jgi:tetratricopeptide (TPR) repeat protein
VSRPKTPTALDTGLSDPGDATRSAAGLPQVGESFGRYVVLHEIGAGGMGVVYAAYDPELDRRVALKVLGAAMSEDTGRARLLREAQTMARISHPNVITVHDVGEVDGNLFIAMELVQGADLRRWLTEHEHPWQHVLDLLVQSGRGLQAAHDQGLVHRDFKPANVLVGEDGLVRVLDFGLARRVGTADNPPSDPAEPEDSSSHNSHTEPLTRTGAVAGTPAYMSPEQHARGELDHRTDQFSFCVTAFEALFGERPFSGNGRMALMLQVTQGEHVPVPKSTPVPLVVVEAVLRGLSPKPADRWPNMGALLEQLERRPSPRRLVIGGLLGTTAVGVAAMLALPSEDTNPCAALADTALLSPDTRGSIEQAFVATGVPYADDALTHTLRGLDRYAQAWTQTRVEVCEATRVRHDRSETAHDLSVACLQSRQRDLAATLAVLAEATPETVEQSGRLVDGLPVLSACDDVERLLAAHPAPSPELQPAVDAAEGLIARGRALERARNDKKALAVIKEAAAAAEATGYPPSIAAAQFELAVGLARTSQREAALEAFHKAGVTATRIRDDRLLASVWIEMGRHRLLSESAHDEAFRLFDQAEAVLAHVPDSGDLDAEVRQARATALSELGRLDEALEEFERMEAVLPADRPLTVSHLLLRGNIHTWQADYPAALADLDDAELRARQTIGALHPSVAGVHNGRGAVLFSMGELADAEDSFRTAYDLLRHSLPQGSPEFLFSLGNVGEIQRMRGNYAQALETMQKVEHLVNEAFPAVHREVGTTNHNIASCYREWGKFEQALPRYDVAIDVRKQVHGPRHLYVANSLTGKGLTLLELGRAAEALPLLEEAQSIREETDAPPRKRARTAFALARALEQTGGDRTRARTLARTARAQLADQLDDTAAAHMKVIDAWLSQHGDEADVPTSPASP